ncbi:MAG: cytochrome c [Chitinophagaceae bacterium]|nr:cytochrome c [Chitinophagaceae bacterium]
MRISTFLQAAAFCCGLMLTLCSCSTEASVQNEFLNTRNIPGQFFTVDGNTDTVLKTSHASLIRIKKGTFEGVVDIEVKEVFTSQEIFQSGLGTMSDGRPLRSAGMIYFNATQEGKNVEPGMPVSIGIATKSVDTAMKLFKGEWTKDSTMNWTNPQALDLPAQTNNTTKINAAALYQTKCASCHDIYKDLTGPALRGFDRRGPWRNPLNILAWVNNPGGFMSCDPYTKDLQRKFGSVMTAFPDVSMDEVTAITRYINEVTPQQLLADDSLYRPAHYNEVKQYEDSVRDKGCREDTFNYKFIVEDFQEYDTTYPPRIPLNCGTGRVDTALFEQYKGYSIETSKERYEFEIETNGWSNIDALLIQDKEVQIGRLQVQVNTTEDVFLRTVVYIPSKRIMLDNLTQELQLYSSPYAKDGKLPLPIGYRAVALTFGSVKNKIMYGVREFTIGTDQTISLDLQETTKDNLKRILLSKEIDGISVEAIEKGQNIITRPCDK